MKKFTLLTVLLVALIPLTSFASAPAPKVYAVMFHADWCGSCKVLGPNITKARGQADLDNKHVLFVKLDLTDATTRHQSGLLASALGMGDFYKTNAGKTGFGLIVNAQTGETLGKLTKDMDSKAITAMINEKLGML